MAPKLAARLAAVAVPALFFAAATASAQAPHALTPAEQQRVENPRPLHDTRPEARLHRRHRLRPPRRPRPRHPRASTCPTAPTAPARTPACPPPPIGVGIGLAASWDRALASRSRRRHRPRRTRPWRPLYARPWREHLPLAQQRPQLRVLRRRPLPRRARSPLATSPACRPRASAATVKHYLGNNSEFLRHDSNTERRRTHRAREIYLPAFEAAVKQGHVGAVMDSYNLIDGKHATENPHFNIEVLRRDWGFHRRAHVRLGRHLRCRRGG